MKGEGLEVQRARGRQGTWAFEAMGAFLAAALSEVGATRGLQAEGQAQPNPCGCPEDGLQRCSRKTYQETV